jgi:hypothetical protein
MTDPTCFGPLFGWAQRRFTGHDGTATDEFQEDRLSLSSEGQLEGYPMALQTGLGVVPEINADSAFLFIVVCLQTQDLRANGLESEKIRTFVHIVFTDQMWWRLRQSSAINLCTTDTSR